MTIKAAILIFSTITGCKKLIQIPPPTATITTSQVFSTDAQATAAAAGMYYNMINNDPSFANSSMTICSGLSADELNVFYTSQTNYFQFQTDRLVQNNGTSSGQLWAQAYNTIYSANAEIDGLNGYAGVHDSVRNELTGEAEFVRAFCNFYLVNLYGDIPLVTTINWRKTGLLNRSPKSAVWAAIISDLKDAQTRLASDFSAGGGERIVPNRWAATALLARAYLYTAKWDSARIEATNVINNNALFSLTSLDQIFLTNSNEAIWQLQQSSQASGANNVTYEGFTFITDTIYNSAPNFYLTPEFLNSFETGDQRFSHWVHNKPYAGINYQIPYKYKQGGDNVVPGGPETEYYMVLRLAEQYLVRAEAEAHGVGSGLSGAISDLNIIRNRAGLANYAGATGQTSVLNAIYHENQIEFFAEWGHRWLDLKRLGTAAQVLSADKNTTVTTNALLYPIPVSELVADPNLTQNPGY